MEPAQLPQLPNVRCRLMVSGHYTLTKGNGGTLELTPDEAQSVVAQLQLLMLQHRRREVSHG